MLEEISLIMLSFMGLIIGLYISHKTQDEYQLIKKYLHIALPLLSGLIPFIIIKEFFIALPIGLLFFYIITKSYRLSYALYAVASIYAAHTNTLHLFSIITFAIGIIIVNILEERRLQFITQYLFYPASAIVLFTIYSLLI